MLAALSRLSPPLRPTLPPKQRMDHQVKLGGDIRLACGRGTGVSTQHKQATSRKRWQVPAGQMTELAAHPVAGHGRPDSAADHKSHPGRLLAPRARQQVAHDQRPRRASAAPDGLGELGAPPHPGGCRQHGPVIAD
jgi:hypothetical protein